LTGVRSDPTIEHPGFDWGEAKNETNHRAHGICFEDVLGIFDDPYAIEDFDEGHSEKEDRWTIIGDVDGCILFVSYAERGDIRRIISARRATRWEKKTYAKQRQEQPRQ